MKLLLHLKSLLILSILLIVGVASSRAAEPDYILDATDSNNTGANNAYNSSCDVEINGITWKVSGNTTMNPWRLGGKSLSKEDRTVYSKTAYSSGVEKVTLEIGAASSVTINSIKLVYSTNADFSSATTLNASGTAPSTTYTFQPTGGFPENAYYKFVFNLTISTTSSNKFVEFKKVEFYNSNTVPADPCTVTFNAGEHGSCSTSSLTEESAGAGVTLPSVTAHTGYIFKGWATTEGATTANAGEAGATYKPSSDCTLYAVYGNLYTVTLGDNSATLTQTTEGGNVTLPSRTGNATYTFAGWSTTNNTVETTTVPTIITAGDYMPTASATLYPVYKRIEGSDGYILSETVSGTTYYMKHDCSATTTKSEAEPFNWDTSTGLLTYTSGSNTYYITHQTSSDTKLVNSTTIPASGKEWTITENTTNKTVLFRSKVQTTRYLGYSSGFKAYAATHTLRYESTGTTYYVSTIPTAKSLQSIAVTTTPTKTEYNSGDHLDRTGMVVTATYEDGSTSNVTASVTTDFDEAAFTTVGTQTVTISYTELGVTKTASFEVTVSDSPSFTVTFNVNGITTDITETAGRAGVTPPTTVAIGDYTFSGWSMTPVTEETTIKPDYVTLTGGKYFPTAATTLYAVYTKNKDVQIYGNYYYIVKGEAKIYVGPRLSDNSYFTNVSSATDALTIYEEDGYLFYAVENTKTYFAGLSAGKADLTFNTDKTKLEAWTKADGATTGSHTYQSATTSRYLAYNPSSPRFATYSNDDKNFFTEASTEFIAVSTPHYISAPEGTATPTASFAETTKNVVADQTVTQTVTTNSTGAVTYTSSNEAIASVDAATGEVTCHKFGTTTITASIAEVPGKFYATSVSYTVNVSRITTEIAFKDAESNTITTANVYADNEYTFTAQTNSDATISYSLSATTYATIDSETGVITFKPATGATWASDKQVTVYAKVDQTDRYTAASSNSLAAKLTISIKDNRSTQSLIFPAGSDKNFVKGETVENFTIAATGAATTVTYTSSNTSIAEVDEDTGEVTIHTTDAGTATITATAAGTKIWNEELGIYNTYNESTATYTITVEKSLRPTISVPSGNYDSAQEVTITADDAFAIIYTLDGSDPSYDIDTEEYHGEMEDPGFTLTINQNCTLKVISLNDDLDAVSGIAQATYTFAFPAAATAAWETSADIHMTGEDFILTAPEGATISYQINSEEKVVTEEQEVRLGFENYGIYTLTVDVVKDGLTTTSIIEDLSVHGFASVPFTYNGGATNMPLCFLGQNMGSDYESSLKFKFSDSGSQLTLMVDEGAEQLSYDYDFNGTWKDGNSFVVEMSIDGIEWETLATHANTSTSYGKRSATFSIPSLEMIGYHYFRWTYTKVSGNFALGNIKVLPAGPSVTIGGEPIHEEAYVGTQVVEVAAPDAVIFYYTTDGSEPTTDSEDCVWATDYKALINVTESCTLKVIAANNDDEPGAVTTSVITIAQPTEPTDQSLVFEHMAVHFTAAETNQIANYEGQPVLGANTTVTYSVANEGDIVVNVNAETGAVRITSATGNGTATITATAAAAGNWREASASYTIVVGNLSAPTLRIADADFDASKSYLSEQFADLCADGGYIAYTITYNDLTPEPALNGDIPGTSSDRVWLPSKFCEATGTYIDGVFDYDDPNDIDITKITLRAVSAMPYIREEGGVKHEEFRAVSDEAVFVIHIRNGELMLNEADDEIAALDDVPFRRISVTRALKANTWNTFCLPFAMTKEQMDANLGSDAEVKALTELEVNEGTFSMVFADAYDIEAGVPYMVRVKNAVSVIEVESEDDIIVNTTGTPQTYVEDAEGNSLTFYGNYSKMLAPRGSFIISSNLYYLVNSDVNVKGFRGYICAESAEPGQQVKTLGYSFEEGTSDIGTLTTNARHTQLYDLQGRMLGEPMPGINIQNGRKVIGTHSKCSISK